MQSVNTIEGKSDSFLQSGGEMGERVRNYDWSKTPVGTWDQWPQSLRTTVSIILNSQFPMFVWWGNELTTIYNDSYIPIAGNKHPGLLGKSGREAWSEIWTDLSPLVDKVFNGISTWSEDLVLNIKRHGFIEETYFTFSYSPVLNETGTVGGLFCACIETTEKVAGKKKLEQSEARFRNMVEQAPVAITLTSGEDVVIETINGPMLQIMGKDGEDEVIGKKMIEVLPEIKDQPILSIVKNVLITGAAFKRNEIPVTMNIKGSRQVRFFNVSYTPLKEEGKVSGVLHVVIDVTEQVLARRKIEESEEQLKRFKFMADNAGDPFILMREDATFAYLNQKALEAWGYTEEEARHIRVPDVDPIYQKDLFSEVFARAQQEVIPPFETLHKRKDGQTYSVEVHMGGLILSGKPHLFAVARDITERKKMEVAIRESEQNLRNIILQAPMAICILRGSNASIEIANEFMVELLGKPAEKLIGQSLFAAVPEVKNVGLEELLEQVRNTGEPYKAYAAPFDLLRENSLQKVYVDFVYEPYREEDGSISAVIVVAIDVTQQVVARQGIEVVVAERTKELAEANRLLEQNNNELKQFAYIASHDLQEPVRKIRTFTQMLEKNLGPVDVRSKNYIDKISSSSYRMLTLIRDVLSFSQLSQEREKFEQVNLMEILQNVLSDFELLIEEKQAKINCPGLPVITAIPLHMNQLFTNLISNALKFSKKDVAPLINVTANVATKEQLKQQTDLDQSIEYFNIRFSDNGIGFDQQNADKIFDIFQRLHGRLEYEGTGIGLAICKKIAINHRGNLIASSTLRNGATFDVFLPKK